MVTSLPSLQIILVSSTVELLLCGKWQSGMLHENIWQGVPYNF